MLADAASALSSARSYHVKGMVDPGINLDIVVVREGWTGTVTRQGVSWSGIVLDGTVWFRGAQLWSATLPAQQAAAFGDHWVRVDDPAAAYGLAKNLSRLERSIPGVVFARHPGLVSRLTDFEGRRVIELRSRTDLYDVLASGTPYPLRWLELDKGSPGQNPCGITLDRFDADVTVEPPQPALVLTQ